MQHIIRLLALGGLVGTLPTCAGNGESHWLDLPAQRLAVNIHRPNETGVHHMSRLGYEGRPPRTIEWLHSSNQAVRPTSPPPQSLPG